ncbi:MAG: sulfite exporter TauE/SafE family protein [Leptolyngbya sp. SIO1D8]|nr:sulfite exporter TauE/SafE family protein [Leptolyngbya sp. SIO1D8]
MLNQKTARPISIVNLSSSSKVQAKFFRPAVKAAFSKRLMGFTLLVAVIVWTAWLTLAGPSHALVNLIAHWEAAVTMILGSMVAGGTSMGGGAVAFPIFTKVLQVPPAEAKVFSLAIQSIGMTAASLTIMAMRTKVEWRFIRWASLGGIPGIILGSVFLAPVLPADVIKFSFTMMVCSFGIVLLALHRTKRGRNLAVPVWGKREQIFSLIAGLWGGVVTAKIKLFCFKKIYNNVIIYF